MTDSARKQLRRNVKGLYVLEALYGFLLILPIIVLFWQANGLKMTEVMILQSIFAAAVIVLEVPTGYISDLFGRRKTLMVAGAAMTFGVTAYAMGYGFIHFLIGELFWAVGVSLASGTDSALLYDTLVEAGEESKYKDVWGKIKSFYMVSAAAAAVLGGFLAGYGLRTVVIAQIPVILLMIPVSYFLKEPEHHKELREEEQKTMKEVVHGSLIHNRKLRWLIVYGALLAAGIQTVLWLYQPYFKLTGLEVTKFGLAFALFNIVAATVSHKAQSIEDLIGKKNSIVAMPVLVVVSLFMMAKILAVWSFLIILLQQIVRGYSKPVISDYVNDLVSGERRATVLSTQSLVSRIGQMVLMPFIGYVADIFSITQALIVQASIIGVGTLVVLALMTKDSVI